MMKKMTYISTILAIGMLFATVSFAQVRTCDLQVTINSPTNNTVINVKDTAWLEFTVKNNGPDPILAADTLFYWDQTRVYILKANSDIAAKATKAFKKADIGLILTNNGNSPTDNSGQFCIKMVNQSTISYGAGLTPLITFEDNDTTNNWSCINVVLKGTTSTSVEQMDKTEVTQLELYPNPAADQVNFRINGKHAGKLTVSVKDIMGREIVYRDYGIVSTENTTPFLLDIAKLSNGIYLFELNTGSNKLTRKITVQR